MTDLLTKNEKKKQTETFKDRKIYHHRLSDYDFALFVNKHAITNIVDW